MNWDELDYWMKSLIFVKAIDFLKRISQIFPQLMSFNNVTMILNSIY